MSMATLFKEFIFRFAPTSPYTIKHVQSSYLISQKQFDVGIKDYYHYLLTLFEKVLTEHPSVKKIYGFEVVDFPQTFKKLTVHQVCLQIEHTLVKSGGRGTESATRGVVPIAGDLSGETYLVRLAHLEKLMTADLIIEYSRSNIKNIQTSHQFPSILKKMVQISPTLYPLVSTNQSREGRTSQARIIECATLFRNMNEPRRQSFFASLLAHDLPVQNINNVFEKIENTYAQIKVLVNIRQTDHHDTLEELRILPALRCGVIIVSEEAPLMKESRYSDFIVWGKLEELPKLIQEVLENYESYYQQIFLSNHFERRMGRIEKSNYLKIQRAIGLPPNQSLRQIISNPVN